MGELAQLINKELGTNVYLCYQCKKCTNGCPLADKFDLYPHQLMRYLQLGRDDVVLRSRTAWLCATCYTCSTRCPQDLDIARIMDVVKVEAQKRGIPSPLPEVYAFTKAGVNNIRIFGRMYELGMMAEMYLRMLLSKSLDFKGILQRDVPMGIKMFLKGKLRLLPARPGKAEGKAPEGALGYYPGCSLHSTSAEYDLSVRAVFKHLGVNLYEPEGWICCGTSPAHSTDHVLAAALPMQNMAIFEKAGLDKVMMPCSACYSRFKAAVYDFQRNEELAKAVEEKTGYEYKGGIQVLHLLEALEDVGLDKIAGKVTRPLEGLKVVSYYGCLITRPPKIVQAPHYEYPVIMDRLVEVTGAKSLDWSYKTYCCGGSVTLSKTEAVLGMIRRIIEDAHNVGAQAIVVACPLCQINLDTRQNLLGLDYQMPVIYITQLLGLAFGLKPEELGFQKHFIDVTPVLKMVTV